MRSPCVWFWPFFLFTEAPYISSPLTCSELSANASSQKQPRHGYAGGGGTGGGAGTCAVQLPA